MNNSPDPSARPLHLSGSLRIETGEQSFDVVAQGEQVVVDLPSIGVLKSLMQGRGDREQFNQITAMLDRHDVDVVIQLKGQTIATLGKSAEPGAMEKLLSLEGVDVRFRELAKAWFKRTLP